MPRTGPAALAVVVAALGLLAPAVAATLRLQPGETLRGALARASDGDVLEIPSGDYRGEVATITQRRLTLRGVGATRPVLWADGRHAEGKAILVVRDGDIRIERLAFRGARVPDRNGAGIRHERGRLVVADCEFVDNENGILAANIADSELQIEDSHFRDAPAATPLPHLVYAGRMARLTVLRSTFSGGRDGHLLKSRARVSEIRDSRFVDGPTGAASYELEFPEGGAVTIVNSTIGQGPGTTNPAIVSFGNEGLQAAPSSFTFTGNRVVNAASVEATFLQLRLRHAGGADVPLRIENNRFYGPGDLGRARHDRGNAAGPLKAYTP